MSIDLPYEDYGHNQNDENGRCAATAMMNSFEFLANTYPEIYGDTALTTGDPESNDSPIAQLDTMMGNAGCGVTDQQAWEGKNEWIETYAPDTTRVHGVTDQDFTNWEASETLTDMFEVNLAKWLFRELRRGQDIEIALEGADHWVTLIGITIENGRALSIRYIDPNCVNGQSNETPGPQDVPATYNEDGYIQFAWQNGDGEVCSGGTIDAWIATAFAESPIPEPVSLLLFGAGVGAIMLRRRYSSPEP